MDYRERPSGILEILNGIGEFQVEEKKLLAGDYSINDNIIVERKTTNDFVISLIDGRLFSQASRLKRLADRPLIIIEGINLYNTGHAVDSKAIKGAIISLSIVWFIPVVFSKDLNDTAQLLMMAGFQDVAYRSESERYGRKPRSLERRKLHILQGLPDIGPKTARKMLEHFDSIEKIITADETELALVKGIGEKRAAMIRQVVK